MHDATEIFDQFQRLWQSGMNAHLSLECRAGHAWVQLQLALPPPHPHQYQHHQHHHSKPGPSPSRRRRRAKRADARAKAAAAVSSATATNSIEASTQTNGPAESFDVAVQATLTDTFDELGHQPPPGPVYLPDEVCLDLSYEEAAVQADLPSQLFLSNHNESQPIPQLDGMTPENSTSLIFHSNSHPYFTSHSHIQNRSAEERRKEKEKDLEEIKKMIESSCRF